MTQKQTSYYWLLAFGSSLTAAYILYNHFTHEPISPTWLMIFWLPSFIRLLQPDRKPIHLRTFRIITFEYALTIFIVKFSLIGLILIVYLLVLMVLPMSVWERITAKWK